MTIFKTVGQMIMGEIAVVRMGDDVIVCWKSSELSYSYIVGANNQMVVNATYEEIATDANAMVVGSGATQLEELEQAFDKLSSMLPSVFH